MWREAVLPARQGRGPLHSAVGGVCRTRHSFRGGPRCRAKHSRFVRAGGERQRVDRGLPTGSVESGRRDGERSGGDRLVSGLEAGADEGHQILQLRVVAVFQLALDFVDTMDNGGVVAAAKTSADLRQ